MLVRRISVGFASFALTATVVVARPILSSAQTPGKVVVAAPKSQVPAAQPRDPQARFKQTVAPLAAAFVGSWDCAGEFLNGTKIAATISVTLELDGTWLQVRHADKPPHDFKALAMWGVEASSGKLISVMHDSFLGARLFTSDGWSNRTIRFESTRLMSAPMRRERFTYAVKPDGKFRMDYEVSKDGSTWKLGDYIVCTKQH